MAAGEFAEPIYKLLEELGDNSEELVLGELIAYLSGDSIRDFVEDFRRHNSMIGDDEDNDDYYEEPDYHLCMDCQASYDINKGHMCDVDETQPPNGTSKYFSSLIPEC